jgi:2-dehydro-3-deoxyphosphogluconate aldolase/(4S)-4-hydroxy-2-oxoglutarate aldolase
MSQAVSQSVASLLQQLEAVRLIGIVRTDSEESAFWASRILVESGIHWIEIPFTVPNAAKVIERLSDLYPQAVIGAGTVMEAREAVSALAAGAQFLVAPSLNEPLIQLGAEQGILVLPGAMTPTEIHKAWSLGAPAVKFFPAQAVGGADFVSAIRGPFPHIPLIATGGIELSHVPGYLEAGTLAVGVGGPLIPKQAVANRDEDRLRILAMSYLDAVKPFTQS